MEYVNDSDTNCNWSTRRKWRSKKETSLSGRQQCQNPLLDLKEYWNPEETCCHLVFNEKQQFKTNLYCRFLRNTMSFTSPKYRKSCGTNHNTTEPKCCLFKQC